MITLHERDVSLRTQKIRKILAPLSKVSGGPAIEKIVSRGAVIWAAHEGQKSGLDWNDWTFKSPLDDYRCSYYELWKTNDGRKFWLEQAYLGLRKSPTIGEVEQIVGLHCDPQDEGKHGDFKRGPHMHVFASRQPLPHSHIALNYCHLDDILSSYPNLFSAMSKAVTMIRSQVLDVIKDAN